MEAHVDLGWIFDVRVNAPLKDVLEVYGFRVGAAGHSSEVNVEEGGAAISLAHSFQRLHMAKVEKTDMPQIDGFLVEHLLRNHIEGNAALSSSQKKSLTDPKTSIDRATHPTSGRS